MITTLTGSNSFELQHTLDARRAEFVGKHGSLAMESVDVESWSTRQVFDVLSAMSFLTPRRMLIMRGLAANKPAADRIQDLLESVADSTQLIFVDPKLDKRSILYKTLKKSTEFLEFAQLDARDAPKWLVAQAKHRGGAPSATDAAYLVSRVGAGQAMLSNELDKLLLYNQNITRQTITLLTEQAPTSTIFELVEAAFTGNVGKALGLYGDQRAQNAEPLAIQALFVWQLHAVALLKLSGSTSPDAVAAQAGISPYVARKSAALASRRQLADIKLYIHELADLELALKTTTADPDELLKNFIVQLGS